MYLICFSQQSLFKYNTLNPIPFYAFERPSFRKSLLKLFHYLCFHTISVETNNTEPPLQSNRWPRSTTSCECLTAKKSNTTRTARFRIQSFTDYLLQTLTTLNLRSSQIGDRGAEHLANVLQQNKVTRLEPFYFPYNHSLTIFYRHSPHWTSNAIKLAVKEHNILRMPYSKIK